MSYLDDADVDLDGISIWESIESGNYLFDSALEEATRPSRSKNDMLMTS